MTEAARWPKLALELERAWDMETAHVCIWEKVGGRYQVNCCVRRVLPANLELSGKEKEINTTN